MKTDNELIAEFMGVRIGIDAYSWHPGSFEKIRIEHLAYHESWNLLMPVVEKIVARDSSFHMQIGNVRTSCRFESQSEPLTYKRTIDAVYEAVVLFIKTSNRLLKV